MDERECISRMVAPGTRRPGKYLEGVVQVHVTRACNQACFGCTQGSQLAGKLYFMPAAVFEEALLSLTGYFGVVGVFGGNPATHPQFGSLCSLVRKHVPYERRGLWCNDPLGWGKEMRETFNPAVSNLNVHLDRRAHEEFKRDWPESQPFGLDKDSQHSPPYVAMKDVLKKACPGCGGKGSVFYTLEVPKKPCLLCDGVGMVYDEGKAWELISRCDINQHWSAMVGMFRGSLRAWFCEVAGAQSILHQDEPLYPDTGTIPWKGWWRLPMEAFVGQVRKHCHECGVPLRSTATPAIGGERELYSAAHADVFRPKRKGRRVELVTVRPPQQEERVTRYYR